MSNESGTTSISDLPSGNQTENVKLSINESNIDMSNIFKEVQNIGSKGNLNLPTRDIPIDPTNVSMDKESSNPNYIPAHEDYINDIYEPHNINSVELSTGVPIHVILKDNKFSIKD